MKILFSIFVTAAVFCSEARVAEEKNRVFTNMQAELQASRDLLVAIETVTKAMDATKPAASRRRLSPKKGSKKGKKSKSSKNNKSSCEMELQQCQAKAAEPKNLYIQTGKECRIDRKGENKFQLISDVGNDTFVFTDRPARYERIILTEEFIDTYKELFKSSNPNVGVTLVSKDTDEFLEPLVVIASNPKMTDNGKVDYKIKQSKSQDVVNSLESYFEGTDSVSFKDCSLFIDDGGSGCGGYYGCYGR